MIPQISNEGRDGMLPAAHGSPSSDLGYDAELTTAQLHAQWVAKYEQVQELWNIDNCQKNDRIETLENALRELVALKDLKQNIEAGRADDLNELAAMERDYDLRKPIAWGAARVALFPENS